MSQIKVENAQYFHFAAEAKVLFYEQELTKRNANSEKKLKMREFMKDGPAQWTALADDERTTFEEKFKALCEEQGVVIKQTPSKEKPKKEKKAKKAKEDTTNKENVENAAEGSAMDVEEEVKEEVKEKKTKKRKSDANEEKKDEDKKPYGGYMKWMNTVFRAQYKVEHPEAKTGEIGKAAGEKWGEMSDEEKKEFEVNQEELEAWYERHPDKRPKEKKQKTEKTEEEKAAEDKRPVSGYMKWMNSVFRAQFKAENPDAKITEVTKAAGAAWSEMSDEEKEEHNAAQKVELEAWFERHPDKRPKQTEPKEPKKEKAPKSAMDLFMTQEFRQKFKDENEGAKQADVNEALSGAWEGLSEEERTSWDEKYSAKLTELGLKREEHEKEMQEKTEKAASKPKAAKKAPKDATTLFRDDEFWAKYKEENPEAKKSSKECAAAAQEAFDALSEEQRGEWQTKWQALVDAMPAVVDDGKAKKPTKPKKVSVPTWKQLYLNDQKAKIAERKPDLNEEQLEKEANIKMKNMSKSEQLGWTDKVKTAKAKAEKAYDLAVAEYEKELAAFDANEGEKMDVEETA